MKKIFTLILLVCFYAASTAQDMFGIANSNYAGLDGISLNPSSIVDSRLGFDLNIITVAVSADNNYLYVPQSNLGFLNFGEIVTDFKNKNYTDAKNYPGDATKNLHLDVLLRGPSVMFHVGDNWFGIVDNVRSGVSVTGVSSSIAKVGYESAGLHYIPLQEQDLNSGNIAIGAMGWGEIGLTYGRAIINNGKNYLKGAVTVKRLLGYDAGYLKSNNFSYKVDTVHGVAIPDTAIFNGADVQYGHAVNESFKDQSLNNLTNGYGWGFDIGFTYEYRPDYESHKYEMDGKILDNPEENNYKWRIGASLKDIGKITFNQNANAFNLNGSEASLTGWDSISFKSLENFDTTLSKAFYNNAAQSNNGTHKFDMALPHALSVQVDYNIARYFYANATWIQHVPSSAEGGIVSTDNIAITPRFEKSWLDVAVPFSYYNYSQFRVGLGLRFGPLIIGSDKLGSLLGLSDLGGMDVYMSLKLPIGRRKIKDSDHDGVSDKYDLCPGQKGTWATRGCPDRDGDGIADKDDSCPDVAGLLKFHGCPDTDGDGIPDQLDDCPTIPGLPQFHGCPDTDGDGIPDPQDSCPTVAGLPQFHGCPDTDGDGIPDREDSCPTVAGLIQFHGCPDTDGDGIPDPQDSCPFVKGPAWNHGCPVAEKAVEVKKEETPVKAVLTPQEQEVIAKVFKNLEFETGKSVIRQVSYPSLNELADLLKKKPAFKLLVDGHTDNVGSAASNLKLSENRANAVKLYLTDKGIEPARITAKGYGLTRPIASNKTPEGRQKNRRVEFTVVQ